MAEERKEEELAQDLAEALRKSEKVVLTCHTNADGDALGSTLGLRKVLMNMGKKATVVTPDLAPTIYSWMPGFKTLMTYERQTEDCDKIIDEADLIIMMDFNCLKRIKSLGDKLESVEGKGRILIDHHTDPEVEADVFISYPAAAATCEITYRMLMLGGLDEYIDIEAASNFYSGVVTDTGGLSYNSSSPELYILVAKMLSKGIDKVYIHDKIFNNKSIRRLKLNGYAIEKKLHRVDKLPIAFMSLSREELESYNYQTGDTEGLVNIPLQAKDLIMSCLILERNDMNKMSFRSKGDFPVNEFSAKYFGGGGHHNAAGGTYIGTISQAVKEFKKDIIEFYEEWSSRASKK
jgi:phosphoesterase RecJ-like protein